MTVEGNPLPAARSQGPGGSRRPDRREVARALARSPHAIEVLDHGLAISPATRVDLVGIDGAGRLVLGLLVAGAAEDALGALEALAFVRRRGVQLAEHLGRAVAEPAARARVVLVAGAATRELCDLLAPLEAAGVELFETCVVESHRGSRTFVAPAAEPSAPARDPAASDPSATEPSAIGSGTTGPQQDAEASDGDELLEDLVRRIERIDDRLAAERSAEALRWRLVDRELCSVQLDGGRAVARLGGESEELVIDGPDACEAFLGRVMERFLELAETGADDDVAHGDLPRPSLGAPQLLTAEEIEAFREPL